MGWGILYETLSIHLIVSMTYKPCMLGRNVRSTKVEVRVVRHHVVCESLVYMVAKQKKLTFELPLLCYRCPDLGNVPAKDFGL